jgi:hypothetical protein
MGRSWLAISLIDELVFLIFTIVSINQVNKCIHIIWHPLRFNLFVAGTAGLEFVLVSVAPDSMIGVFEV